MPGFQKRNTEVLRGNFRFSKVTYSQKGSRKNIAVTETSVMNVVKELVQC